MNKLREEIVKLANDNPALRKHLAPLLERTAGKQISPELGKKIAEILIKPPAGATLSHSTPADWVMERFSEGSMFGGQVEYMSEGTDYRVMVSINSFGKVSVGTTGTSMSPENAEKYGKLLEGSAKKAVEVAKLL